MGFVELMKNRNLSNEDYEKYLDIIQKSGERLNELLNGLIDMARIETGQVEVNI